VLDRIVPSVPSELRKKYSIPSNSRYGSVIGSVDELLTKAFKLPDESRSCHPAAAPGEALEP
jgi:hypothetical protein